MRITLFRLVLTGSFIFSLLFINACSSGDTEQNMDASKMNNTAENQQSMNSGKKDKGKILYWKAPMNPTEIYDKPGKSKMGMDLVPVYENDVSSGSTVKINPVTVQNMGVRTAPVERIDFSRKIRTVGIVAYNEEKLYTVSAKISGWIEKLYVDFTGKEVRKNKPLLEIYSPELVTTQQEYLLALKNKDLIGETKYVSIREGAESLLNSTRQRLLYWDIPQSEITRLEQRGTVKKTLTLESPANGVVIHKNAVDGSFVKEGAALYQIADLSTVWIDVSVYDNEAPWLSVGQKAQMELSYLPGQKFDGRVSYIYPYLNDKARDLKARLEFPNPGLQLKPGMYSNVTIQTDVIPNAIVVPTEAVIRSGQRNIVFISLGDGRFEPREVTIGQESEDRKIRILGGLLGNENVVVSAQFLLDSESRLQEAIQKMLSAKSTTEMEMPVKSMDQSKQQDPVQKTSPDQSKMTPDKNQKMKKDEGAEMKCGGGMDMPEKSKDQTMEEQSREKDSDHSEIMPDSVKKMDMTKDAEMKCGSGMDMSEGKNAAKKSEKKDEQK